ncbi:hypothetical protein [Mycolicibacterium sp. S2-37]|uniref:hypothetical protein n=1 Tax=Mycolicibacterium sp. S2-37 TaxID=2810297 RepID=UPI001F5EDFC9|nr:hypothetical protein [Mycolicibacterium sp. S2-37]
MPQFKDAQGVRWSVRRRWMPLLDYLNMASWGLNWFGVVMFVIALPFLIVWPFWFLAKFCGVPWKIVVTRDGEDVTVEKVKGWQASRRRVEEIARGIRAFGEVPAAGLDPDLRPYS